MTIRVSWTKHIPIINKDIPRTRILRPGETLSVVRSEIYTDYIARTEEITVINPDHLSVFVPKSTQLYHEPYTFELDEHEINYRYRDDEYLHEVRLYKGFRERGLVRIEWEPTLPARSRK